MNDRHPLRDFHDGPGIHAHRKAEYTNATAPLPDSKINRGTYRLTEESIYELLGPARRTERDLALLVQDLDASLALPGYAETDTVTALRIR